MTNFPPILESGDYMLESKIYSDGEMVQGLQVR